jgi:hypothetical protein
MLKSLKPLIKGAISHIINIYLFFNCKENINFNCFLHNKANFSFHLFYYYHNSSIKKQMNFNVNANL